MLGGGIIAFVPTLSMTILCKNGFGGADIKLAGASGLMLGFMGGSIGYLIGLLFAVVFNLIYNKVKGRSNEIAFPMLPFLSCGLMLGYNEFEQLAVRNGWKKDYSLHRLPHDNVQPLVDILRGAAKEYICY